VIRLLFGFVLFLDSKITRRRLMMVERKISPTEVLVALSTVLDLAQPELANHHKVCAYISLKIADEMKLEEELRRNLFFSALIHDIGILSLRESIDAHQIDAVDPHRHAYIAYRLLKENIFFKKVAPRAGNIVLYHHAPWREMENDSLRTNLLEAIVKTTEEEISIGSYILSLADKISILIKPDKFILHQAGEIRRTIEGLGGRLFPEDVIDAFLSVSSKESFWLELTSPYLDSLLFEQSAFPPISLDWEEEISIAHLICDITDFKSSFTAVHSFSVGELAEKIASFCGFSEEELQMMKIAGYMHDLGKLAIPIEVLEKNGRLTPDEFEVVKAHPFYTYMVLSRVKGWERIKDWASFHHEHLDGTGYPFHLKEEDLDLGSRIVAVADIFSAVREYRPYRGVMGKEDVIGILKKLVEDKALDGEVVSLVEERYDDLDAAFLQAQFSTLNRYQRFWQSLAHISLP
jgi:HD-GYP domain-containing protein (c-di-GMP phosphodiesterase class II)